jgi:hypothetical protein
MVMIDRRKLLEWSLLTAIASLFGHKGAIARATAPIRRDNCSFANEMRRNLRDAARRGLVSADAEETVRCPLCLEYITVSAQDTI